MTDAGKALPVSRRPSPNHGERRTGPTDILLLHYTGMADAEQAIDRLCDPQSGVSSHYFVHEDGTILQLVEEERRAWHAGMSSWAGETDINSRSIGIEIANPGHAAMAEDNRLPPYPDLQIDAVIALCRTLVQEHAIPKQRILAHSDVAPARKSDPGEAFPWARLAGAGIGHWADPKPPQGGRFLSAGDAGQPVEALQTMLRYYGYGIEISGHFDEPTKHVVTAFQRHFRQQHVDGVADASTIQTLHDLISTLP